MTALSPEALALITGMHALRDGPPVCNGLFGYAPLDPFNPAAEVLELDAAGYFLPRVDLDAAWPREVYHLSAKKLPDAA